MNILILTPIKVEHRAILAYLDARTEKIVGSSRYVLGIYKGRHNSLNIATCQTGSGNSVIALATEKAIHQVKPDIVILAGVAGGVKDVAIGDVVVGTKFYGYDSGKETEAGFVVRPEAGYYSRDLLAIAQSVAEHDLWRNRVADGAPKAKVVLGPIASGDKVIAATDGPVYQRLKQSFNDTTAIEMESYGFGYAMVDHRNIAIANIRGISDLLEGKSKADGEGSQEKAAAHMAAFIFELLDQLEIKSVNTPNMDVKELVKAAVNIILPIVKMGTGGQHTGQLAARLLLQKIKALLTEEDYDLLKEAANGDDDAKADARSALKKAIQGKEDLQMELEKLLKDTGNTGVQNSKNVVQNSNLTAGGNIHIGDNNSNNYYSNTDSRSGQKDNPPGTDMKGQAQKMQQLVASGNTGEAIKLLVSLTTSGDRATHLEALNLSERWEGLARKLRLGAIRNDDANIERNQIVNGLLDLIGAW